jgi:Tol biopolymer transport system component
VRLQTGVRLGPYEVLAFLGAGGMAEVYRARDERLKREVALKMVTEALSSDPDLLRRFEQEARLAGSLNHPNLVAVHDVGVHDGTPYFVTELLRGESLRARLARGPVPTSTALDWATQMARGLAAAHARGIVHRDVKPDNVFVCSDGQVKLLDFGIAKLAVPTGLTGTHDLMEATVTPTGGATRTGSVLGTPGYMSPEQLRGEPIDARSDIFSWAATVYEVLSGRRAFPGATLVESGYSILHRDPEPLPAEVPTPVAEVVLRCLDKEPARRIQSASDLAFALEVVGHATGSTARNVLPASRRKWSNRLVLLLVAAMLGGAAAVPFIRSPTRGSTVLARPITFREGAVRGLRFTPDGRTVLFSASWQGETYRVYTTTLDSADYHPLDIDDASIAAISHQGELAVIRHPSSPPNYVGTLARLPGVGGAPREIAGNIVDADWAPNGVDLAVIRYVAKQWVVEFPIGHPVYRSIHQLRTPRVSPNGDSVAFIEHPFWDDNAGGAYIVTPEGRKESIAEGWSDITGLVWLPTGQLLLSGRELPGTGMAIFKVGLRQKPRVLFTGLGDIRVEDVSRTGRVLLLVVSNRKNIATANLDTGKQAERVGWFWYSSLAGVSDDGRAILFTDFSEGATSDYQVFIRKTPGSIPVRLGRGVSLALSPDGEWAASFQSEQPSRLWLLPVGPEESRALDFPGLSFEWGPGQFTPDGKRVVLLARDSAGLRGHLIDLPTGGEHAVTAPLNCCLSMSPDGKSVAALPLDGVVTVYPLDGGPPQPFPELGHRWPVGWGRSGLVVREPSLDFPLKFSRLDRARGALEAFATITAEQPVGVTRAFGARVTPDEKMVAYEQYRYTSTAWVVDLSKDL